MLARFWEICKTHPYWVGGGVLFAVILIYLMSRGSSASSSSGQAGIYDITQDPNVVAANAAQAESQNANNAAVAVAQIQADTANQTTQASLLLGQQQISAAQDVTDKQTAAVQDIQDKQTAAELDAMNLQTTTSAATYASYFQTDLAEKQALYNASVTLNQSNNDAATQQAQIAETGAVSMYGTGAQTAITLAGLSNTAAAQSQQTQITLAGLADANTYGLAQLGLQSQESAQNATLAGDQITASEVADRQYTQGLEAAYAAGSPDGASNAGIARFKTANATLKALQNGI